MGPLYYSKIKVVEDLIEIIGLYIECFRKSFGNRIILSIFPYSRSLNDLKISELCVIPANLIGGAAEFMRWRCYIYYPNIYGLPLNLPTGTTLDFLPCYQPNYSFLNTVKSQINLPQGKPIDDEEDSDSDLDELDDLYEDDKPKRRRKKKTKKRSKKKS